MVTTMRLRDRAADLRETAGSIDTLSMADRQRAKRIDELAAELEELAEELAVEVQEALQQTREPGPAEDTESASTEVHDTVVYVMRSTVEELVGDGARKPPTPLEMRKNGYGGGLSLSYTVLALDMTPVYDLIQSLPELKRLGLPIYDSYETMGMFGIMGYAGIGNGMRIGGAAWGGDVERSISRETTVTGTTTSVDSVFRAEVEVRYGGLFLEKAFAVRRFSLLAGGVIGGGSMDLAITRTEGEEETGRTLLRRYDDGITDEVNSAFISCSSCTGDVSSRHSPGCTWALM